jgi:hypothetical protein
MKSARVEPAIVKSIPVEAGKSVVESASVEAPKSVVESPTVETATVETAAMRPGIREIWLAERGSAQESSCGCQSPSGLRPGSMFA